MRKDWHEPYYEQESKPFESRWPEGHVYRTEEFNPFGHNVKYPAGFDPSRYEAEDQHLYDGGNLGLAITTDSSGLQTDLITGNLGPQHPSTHGVFRMTVTLSGETIEELQPVMGYMHRNHEQIGERNTWLMNFPFTDRLDYLCSMNNNFAYAIAVEQLLGSAWQPPYRAEVLRVLMAELNRISSHFWSIGFLLNDLGAFFTPMLYALETREMILDFFEATAGSRLLYNYMRFGGVSRDIPDRMQSFATLLNDKVRDMDTMEYLTDLITERLPRAVDEMDTFLTTNEILRMRTVGVGLLPPEMAIAYSTSGPILRASGVPFDLRRAVPYSIYPELEFDVAVRNNGDIYDRYLVRIDEIRQSLRILQQLLPRLEQTKGQPVIGGKGGYSIKVPEGETYRAAENPRGELGFYCVSQGDGRNPWRYHVRAPSFINLTPMGLMSRGHKIADAVGILGSIDIVLGETDR